MKLGYKSFYWNLSPWSAEHLNSISQMKMSISGPDYSWNAFCSWPSKFNAASLHWLANFANLPPLFFSTCQPCQTSFFSHNSSLNLLNYTKSFFFGLTIKHFTRAQKYCTQMSFVTFVTNSMSAQVVPSVLLALVLNVPRMLEMSPVKPHN